MAEVVQDGMRPVRRFLTDALKYFPASVLPALFALVGAAVFTRVFSPSEYGLYSLMLAVVGPTVTVLSEWAAQPIGRFYAEYLRRNRTRELLDLVAWLCVGVAALVAAMTALVLVVVKVGNIRGMPLSLCWAAFSLVLVQSVTAVTTPILPASLRPDRYRTVVVLSSLLSLALPIAFVTAIGPRISLLLLGQAGAKAMMLPLLFHWSGVNPLSLTRRVSLRTWHMVRRFARYGVPMGAWFLAASLLYASDRYIIQLYLGSAAVGIYSANYGLVSMAAGLLNTPVIMAAFPVLMKLWGDREYEQARLTLARVSELYVIGAGAFVGGVAVVGKPIVQILLGAGFHEGYIVQLPVAAGAAVWGFSTLGHKSMEFAERTRIMVWDALAAAAVNLALNLILVPHLGYVAAAYTTLISYALYTMLIWWQSRLLVPWDLSIWAFLLAIGAASLAVVLSRTVVPAHASHRPLLDLLLGGGSFLALYIVLTGIVRWGAALMRSTWRIGGRE